MTEFKLSNILLESTPHFFKQPALYCRNDNTMEDAGNNTWKLSGPGTFDFTTFFNALSVVKWKRYTCAKNFHLHLELKGGAATYTQTRTDTYSWYSEKLPQTSQKIAASDDWHSIDFDITYTDLDIMDGFILDIENDVYIRHSYYYTDIEKECIRPVELALCTTTFKKEDYITRNIKLVRDEILNSNEPISTHFTMHVVDNGRTLDAEKLTSSRIIVHPNPNVGGAGGFARGMIEALEQKNSATHVLLMDDDVEISPESIIRTFNLLSIVNDEYKQSFISGAMMNMDEPEVRVEDVGYMTKFGVCAPAKIKTRMNVLHEAVTNEAFRIPYGEKDFEDMANQYYAAWWYCVIPVPLIKENGLPLPIFVRDDDVEYGNRCHPKHIMTMNGICLWHSPFAMRYNAAVERYQVARNTLIDQFTTNVLQMSDFMGNIHDMMQLELKKYNYTDAELILDGLEDFLRGPDFIARPGQAEKSFLQANKNKEKLQPINEIYDDVKKLGVDLNTMTTLDITRSPRRSKQEAFIDFVTFNGQRFGLGQNSGVAVIDAAGWEYPAGRIRGKSTIVAVDIPHRKATIRHRDKKRFDEVWERYKKDVRTFHEKEKDLHVQYAAARVKLTSLAFWKAYLGLDK